MSTATETCSIHRSPQISIHSHAGAEFFCTQLLSNDFVRIHQPRVLIAGCGSGHEAVAIQERLAAIVDAVDIQDFVHAEYKNLAETRFQVASVSDLPFEDASFDAIFYHHVIEHVSDPQGSLAELARVLKPNGWLFVGTPNRHRLISSIGAYQQSDWEATFYNKTRDNLRDWKDRLYGRFRNELGAHAGFSQNELDAMLAVHFEQRNWLTEQYLRFKYGAHAKAWLLPFITNPATCWFLAPSIYAICRRSCK